MTEESTALAVRAEQSLAHMLEDQSQLALLRNTLTTGLNENEFGLFLATCKATALNPFMRQIHAVVRGTGRGRKLTIQVGVDGFRLLAERSGTYAGQTGPFWCGPDGDWKDVWLSSEPPAAAKVGVLKRGFAEPIYAVATYAEYVQMTKEYDRDGNPTGRERPNAMWARMPSVMLAKCAETLALRKACPAEMSGLYSDEEMGQADAAEATSAVEGEVVQSQETTEPQKGRAAGREALREGTAKAEADARAREQQSPDAMKAQAARDAFMAALPEWAQNAVIFIEQQGKRIGDLRQVINSEKVSVNTIKAWAEQLPPGTDPYEALTEPFSAKSQPEAAKPDEAAPAASEPVSEADAQTVTHLEDGTVVDTETGEVIEEAEYTDAPAEPGIFDDWSQD